MAIGLKCGSVELAVHDPEWEQIARETIGTAILFITIIFGFAANIRDKGDYLGNCV